MRPTLPRRAIVVSAALGLAAAAALAGCTGDPATSDFGTVEGVEGAPGSGEQLKGGDQLEATMDLAAPAVGKAPIAATPADRMLVRKATVVIVADDVTAAGDAITSTAKANNGFVVSIVGSSSMGDVAGVGAPCAVGPKQSRPTAEVCPPTPVVGPWVTVSIKVPATRYQAALDAINSLGEIATLSATTSDVTDQAVDLDARISAQKASVRRVSALMRQASDISEIIAIEKELTKRQETLESLQAQRRTLADSVALATITATVTTAESVAQFVPPGELSWWAQVWDGFASSWAAVVIGIAIISPLLVLLLAAGLLIWWLVQRASRGRSAPGADEASN
ncbi:MAG: DUF4349 domain-containing protein [Candidatus Nanopelagicales bacterium]|nr:DUF4349 domain-containing protein [Candidatus Nanopelagicales bacterium]